MTLIFVLNGGNMKSRILLIIFIAVLCFSASAQQVQELFSPTFMSMGLSSVSEEAPMADLLNPAASGDKQRVHMDASYFILMGLDKIKASGCNTISSIYP